MTSLDRYLNDISKYPLLTPKEEKDLYSKLSGRGKKKAGEKLVVSNLRLVIKIANHYKGSGLDLEDLINEGNLGLCTAIKKFDPSRGVKFSTYASYWIKQNMIRALEVKSRTIRLPSGVSSLSIRIKKFHTEFQSKNNRQPTIAETAKKFKIKQSRAKQVLRASIPTSSLDIEVDSGGGDKSTIGELFVEDFRTDKPDALAESSDEKKFLGTFLDKLTEREKDILEHRFGLKNHDYHTLEMVGDKYGLTRERIRQIQSVALLKLRGMIQRKISL